MILRVPSGEGGLDLVLGGGLPTTAINVLAGLPGSGKTILAQQYIYRNATPAKPALYLSTVSEPYEKILRFAQTLSFFKPEAIGEFVFYDDIGNTLNDRGLTAALDRITDLIKQHRPALIVIDSFKVFHTYATDPAEYRRFLHQLAAVLSAFPVCSFWVGEYSEADLAIEPEFAVADAILHLASRQTMQRQERHLEVVKLRGSDFLSGKHAYRITGDGLRVFPRLADVSEPAEGRTILRSGAGSSVLDSLITDGLWSGASALVAGPSGSGKTTLGLDFICDGARRGEPGLIASLQETPAQLERAVQGFGWSTDYAGVKVMYRSPVDLYIDEWFFELQECIARNHISRLVIDSLGYLSHTVADKVRFREYIYSLLQRCAAHDVTVIMTLEVPELGRITHLTDANISHLADIVVLLEYVWTEPDITRSLTVLKARASASNPRRHSFQITSDGISLGTGAATSN